MAFDDAHVVVTVGAAATFTGDSWSNTSGLPNTNADCGAVISNDDSATALSALLEGGVAWHASPRWRLGGDLGFGFATYSMSEAGRDVFLPDCRPSPGVKPVFYFDGVVYLRVLTRASASPLPHRARAPACIRRHEQHAPRRHRSVAPRWRRGGDRVRYLLRRAGMPPASVRAIALAVTTVAFNTLAVIAVGVIVFAPPKLALPPSPALPPDFGGEGVNARCSGERGADREAESRSVIWRSRVGCLDRRARRLARLRLRRHPWNHHRPNRERLPPRHRLRHPRVRPHAG